MSLWHFRKWLGTFVTYTPLLMLYTDELTFKISILTGQNPKLSWSHQGSVAYLDGMNHVTHGEYDCLEVTLDDRYLITIQITFRFTLTKPPIAVNSYFTLTRFRNHEAYLIAKSQYMVPKRSHRSGKSLVPRTIVLSEPLRRNDLLCVAVSHPELIYASSIDNFFGTIAIWKYEKINRASIPSGAFSQWTANIKRSWAANHKRWKYHE